MATGGRDARRLAMQVTQGGLHVINRRTFIASAAGLAVLAAAGAAFAGEKGLVGISMPTKSSTRWISDGESMVKEFTALGYDTDLQYAEDDIPNQLAQIENMVTKGAKVLIIAAIDGTTLSDILKKAHEAGAKVFAYDRLISKTGDVDYYTTFDNFGVGVLQGTSLINGLKERFPSVKPWNVELFGGSPDDTNAFYFYDGAMSVLQPLIDAGDIAVVSGQMGMDKVGTLRWDGAVAQARMDNLLSATTPTRRSMVCWRLTMACRAASSRHSRVLVTFRARKCRSSPARTPSFPRSRA